MAPEMLPPPLPPPDDGGRPSSSQPPPQSEMADVAAALKSLAASQRMMQEQFTALSQNILRPPGVSPEMITPAAAPGHHEARGPPQAPHKDLPPPQRRRDVADPRSLRLGRQENPCPEDRYGDLEGEEAPIECWEPCEVSNNTVRPLQDSRGKCGRPNPDDRPRGSAFDRLSRGSAF